MMPASFFSAFAQVTQTRVKICGITRPSDALAAVDSGADAIGLVFYPSSPRAVSVQQAIEIAAVVPPFVTIVSLFVDEPVVSINRILAEVPVDLMQFHGAESAQFCAQFARPWIKALRVKPETDIAGACIEHSRSRGILLDAWQEGLPGGTGKVFDWHLAMGTYPLPVVLAGGLNDANVADAMAQVKPAAVDVSGGVEQAPGIKDPDKIARFIAAVRAADQIAE